MGRPVVFAAVFAFSGGCLAADGPRLPANPALGSALPMDALRRDAELGNVKAEYLLGCCYNGDNGLPREPALAAKWWARAAEQGSAEAQYCLGLSYYTGQGVSRDAAEAARWWRLAADQDHPQAQYFLGLSYCAGMGVPRSPALALTWLGKSARNGNVAAIEALKRIAASPG